MPSLLNFLFCLFEKQTDLPASASSPRRPQQPDAGQAEARAKSRSPKREARAQNASAAAAPRRQTSRAGARPGLTAVRDPRGLSEVPFPRTTKGGGEKGLLCVTESPGAQSVGLLRKRRSGFSGLGPWLASWSSWSTSVALAVVCGGQPSRGELLRASYSRQGCVVRCRWPLTTAHWALADAREL